MSEFDIAFLIGGLAGLFAFVWWIGGKLDDIERKYRIKRYRPWDKK